MREIPRDGKDNGPLVALAALCLENGGSVKVSTKTLENAGDVRVSAHYDESGQWFIIETDRVQ